MNEVKDLAPRVLWAEFDAITKVPRPSKKEEQIIEYLLEYGRKHNIETHKDAAGNILMRKPATPGYENRQSIILQSHIDMVCEKNSDVEHDFLKDPIRTYVDGNWVKAKGTTLGADDGIGVAAQLAVLTDPTIEHGPIECLFTVDEETGLTGAFELKAGFFNSKILLNLDSEDEGELFIGCAGGMDTTAYFSYDTEPVPKGYASLEVRVTGLRGGHSGDDINKGLGNSIKILTRILEALRQQVPFRLASIQGGNLRNAIAREAFAALAVEKRELENVEKIFNAVKTALINEYKSTEEKLTIELIDADPLDEVMEVNEQDTLIQLLLALPHGVIEMSREIQGLVETSTNLASIQPVKSQGCCCCASAKRYFITTSQRSSVESSKDYITSAVASVFKLAGCEVTHSDGYPGWAPNTDSPILKVTEEAYKRLFKTEPIVRAIHAGLECGLFLEKYPDLDMVSFGPTIRGAHSPDERIDIETTVKFWDLLLEVLRNAPVAK